VRVCPRCHAVYTAALEWCVIDRAQLTDQEVDPLIGSRIERYEIKKLIGTGGLGRVYHARHAHIDREYAIKVLFGDFSADPKFQERFRREANSASQIKHPNVVRVEDFGTTQEGLTFLAMEMLRGRTLESAIERGPFRADRAAGVARQVLSGLGAAHDLGFVHRDVKPQNIMLLEQEDDLVKILDFGAVAMRVDPTDVRLTTIGDLVGTPTYMSPEQCQAQTVGPTSDLYTVGVMLYEMITGSPPFVGRGRAEVILKHIMEAPPELWPQRGIEKLVANLLEKDPAKRPQSAAQAIAMIDALDLSRTDDLVARPRGTSPELPMIDSSEIQLLGDRPSQSDEFESATVRDRFAPSITSPTLEIGPRNEVDSTLSGSKTEELGVLPFAEFAPERPTVVLPISGSAPVVADSVLRRWIDAVKKWLKGS
jgi:serine/threonine protein kinase